MPGNLRQDACTTPAVARSTPPRPTQAPCRPWPSSARWAGAENHYDNAKGESFMETLKVVAVYLNGL
ncbi:MAG: hypothetical protein K0R41_670 [Geminicoccaceae bacterium]|nr:hypothetical protein [Geminicoccaceae bacterium]